MTAIVVVAGSIALWTAPRQQVSLARDSARELGAVVVRGFTDAPAGTVVVTGEGSESLLELRVVEGQRVKRGEIIAVLANFPRDDSSMRSAEAQLEQARRQHDSLAAGIRPTKRPLEQADEKSNGKDVVKAKAPDTPKIGISEQEAVVRLSDEKHKLKVFEMQHSSLPEPEKELEVSVSEQKSERDRAQLRVLKETLAADLVQSEADIAVKAARLETARAKRDHGLVRAPLDGVVVQIWAHPGERFDRGIAQIVDMNQLRVVADVDETLIGRIVMGGKVQVVFRGEKRVHEAKVVRVAETVKRMLSMGSFGSGTTNVNVVQVEVRFDDQSQVPQMVGREAQVTFF